MMGAASIVEVGVPAASVQHQRLAGADFADGYQARDPQPQASAMQTWLDMVARTPRWTNELMAVRNRLVRLVGLKDLGHIGDLSADMAARDPTSYRCGDRVGIFEIRHLSDDEVVMGQDDKHLDVQVSLCKRQVSGEPVLQVSTVVHVHNALGHVYMAVIKPFHRRIVRAMLARAIKAS